MLHCLLTVVLFLGPFTQAMTPKPDAAPATQPAVTANAQNVQQSAKEQAVKAESLTAVLGRTQLGQLVEGKKTVTLADARNPLFWIDTIRDLAVTLLGFIPRLIVAGLFLIFFYAIYRTARKVLTAALAKSGVDKSIRDMLGHILKWAIMGFGLIIACNQIGIQIVALLTGVSIIGLAVGFAAQETLANFIAGIVIFWDKPFKIGDTVEIEGTTGQIQRVTFRSTRILDGAGKIVVFPNTHMLSKKLSNNTAHPLTKVRIEIAIAYSESISEARRVLLDLVDGDDRLCIDPPPSVGVAECAPGGVKLALSFWVLEEALEGQLKGEYLERAKIALDDAGIQIPTAYMQILLDQPNADEGAGATRRPAFPPSPVEPNLHEEERRAAA